MSTPPPKVSRAVRRADGANGAPQSAERAAPSAPELAEALFLATQAFKATGRDCAEEADPALRIISIPRGRVLEAFAQAEAEEGGASMDAGTPRGRHRFHHGARGAHAERERVRMGDLAAALGFTARNLTTIVDGLEHEGLLTRRQHPEDRRAILLELTEKGHAHIAQIHALHHAIAERFFAPLDAGERTELLRLLAKVRGNDCGSGHTDTP